MRILHSVCLLTVLGMTACAREDSDETGTGTTALSFAGQYAGTLKGTPMRLSLAVQGAQLNGVLAAEGEAFQVTGRIDGDRAHGWVREVVKRDAEGPSKFKARLARDGVSFEVKEEGEIFRFQMRRIVGGAPPLATGSPPRGQRTRGQAPVAAPSAARRRPRDERDPRLVGAWRITIMNRSILNSTTTYVNTWLDATGRYQYGGSQSLFTLKNASGLAENSNIETGEWKTGNGTLYYRHPPSKKWLVWGTYNISGGAVAFYPSGGGKQLWER